MAQRSGAARERPRARAHDQRDQRTRSFGTRAPHRPSRAGVRGRRGECGGAARVKDSVALGTSLNDLAREDGRTVPRLTEFDAVEVRLAEDVRAGRFSPFVRPRFRARAASLQCRLKAADADADAVARAASDLERDLRAGASTTPTATRFSTRPADGGHGAKPKDVAIIGGG